MKARARRLLCVAFVGATLASAPARAAESVAEFYRGKTIRVIDPFTQTGVYGALTRALADNLPRHLPGEPRGRGEIMPGAGGLQAANWLYNSAPRDGSVIGVLYDNMPTLQGLGLDNAVRFDTRRFTVLGSLNRGETGLVGVMKRAGVPTVAAARDKVAVLGATGAGAAQYIVPIAMNRMLGTKFNVIPSYRTVADTFLAMEAGEVDGLFTNYTTIEEARPQWIAENRLDWLAQSAAQADPAFPDVPLLQDIAGDSVRRDAFAFLAMSRAPGKIVLAPPDVPADRAQALRDALIETFRDPEFVHELEGMIMKIEPRSAAEAMDIIRQTVDVDAAALARVRELMNADAGRN